jgi:hypothetical protein
MATRPGRFPDWGSATTGEPVLVHDVDGQPSYWTVPIEADGRVIGFVRVGLDGVVSASGVPRDRRAVVTGITEADAAAAVSSLAEEIERPVYVHDGPPGREAWLVRAGTRRYFVTAAGVRTEPAGKG